MKKNALILGLVLLSFTNTNAQLLNKIKKAKDIFDAGYQTAIEYIKENEGILELSQKKKKSIKA